MKVMDVINLSRGEDRCLTTNDKDLIYEYLLAHQTEDIILEDIETYEEYEPILYNFEKGFFLKKIKK